MSRNPLLYSDQSEVEDINTIEPIEEKRSFIFYFIVLANSLLVLLVLLIIWSLFSKTPNTSFDQQLKAWTQQVFSTDENIKVQPISAPIAPVVKIDTSTEQTAIQKKELALKIEQAKRESLAITLKEEKAATQQSIDKTKTVENSVSQEATIVPNAAKSIPEKPTNTPKTQLEQILEAMQNQN